jgi:hypothetical protein
MNSSNSKVLSFPSRFCFVFSLFFIRCFFVIFTEPYPELRASAVPSHVLQHGSTLKVSSSFAVFSYLSW